MGAKREIYEGVVTDDQDPEKRGRLLVKCRAMLDDGEALPDWVEPCFPFAGVGHGWFFVPSPGDAVELEVVVGDDWDDMGGEATAFNPEVRWRAALYGSTDDVPEEFRQDGKYAKRMGIKSKGGALLLLDDDAQAIALVASKIKLVAEDSDEPLVLGKVLKDFMGALLDQYVAHTHGTGVGPSGPPLTAAQTVASRAQYLDNDAILSGVSFTKK